MAALRALVREHGAGLVVVSHDARLEAEADRVLRLDDGRLDSAPGRMR